MVLLHLRCLFLGESRKVFHRKKYSELAARQITDLRRVKPSEMLETPVDAYYIRTGLPGLLSFQYDPLGDIQWNITIAGLARNNFNLSVASLKRRASPMGSVVMECSGNTRFWRFGLKSIGNFTKGIRLADLIDELYSESKYKNGGKGMPQHILVEGFDNMLNQEVGRKGLRGYFDGADPLNSYVFGI